MELSSLPHTWIFDVDGTIVKHNGYKIDGHDSLLDGVKEFFNNIPAHDVIIFLTARKNEYLEDLKDFLSKNDIRYNQIITDIPMGERIIINDMKPSGLKCAYAINKKRDDDLLINYNINNTL